MPDDHACHAITRYRLWPPKGGGNHAGARVEAKVPSNFNATPIEFRPKLRKQSIFAVEVRSPPAPLIPGDEKKYKTIKGSFLTIGPAILDIKQETGIIWKLIGWPVQRSILFLRLSYRHKF